MPPTSFLTPKPPALLQVSQSQAISNSSSFISSTSSSSLFDRISNASSGYLTDISSPITPSTAEFGNREGEGVTQLSDSPIKEQASLPDRWDGRDSELLPSQSRLPQSTNLSLSTRLDRACALEPRSSVRSYSQNGTPFVSLIPVLRNRLEQGNSTVATRRALEIMDSYGRPGPKESVGGAVDAPVISGPASPVEDWSNDFDLGSSSDLNVSVLFPSASDRSLLDEVEQDSVLSPILPKFSIKLPSTPVLAPVTAITPLSPFTMLPKSFVKFPSTPVLNPVSPVSPCSPFTLGTPALSTNWDNSRSSISTLVVDSLPPSPISSPAIISFNEEEMARIMHTVISLPTRTRHPFSGSPEGVDPTTVMRVEIASTLAAGRTGTLVGLGVAMPVIHPPLPPTLFPLHHPPGTALNSRRVFSLRNLSGQPFDDRMFEIEQNSSSLPSRNDVHELSEPSGFGFKINESLPYSPLEGCTTPIPLLPLDFDCSDAFQVEQTLSKAHTTINRTSPIAFGKSLVGLGLGLGILTEASVESQPLPADPSTTGMQKYCQSLKKYN